MGYDIVSLGENLAVGLDGFGEDGDERGDRSVASDRAIGPP